ncbi:hypothetical protein [Psychromonas sp. KJ10-2]|uniref:hypothetical protein n=1 Tax=Psychromonas sp. KJ10-2 TaxID=3391822 RepID=UPI0039B43B7E
MKNNSYWDPVKKRINERMEYSLPLKKHIKFICGSNISDTRLYRSEFTKFKPTYCIEDGALLYLIKKRIIFLKAISSSIGLTINT